MPRRSFARAVASCLESLTPSTNAYSKTTRRPVFSAYALAASTRSAMGYTLAMGIMVFLTSSEWAWREMDKVT